MKQECIEKVVTDFCITWYTSKDDVMYAAMHYRNGESHILRTESIVKAADHILMLWRRYTDEKAFILSAKPMEYHITRSHRLREKRATYLS